jgi:hypothetical protein
MSASAILHEAIRIIRDGIANGVRRDGADVVAAHLDAFAEERARNILQALLGQFDLVPCADDDAEAA